MTYGSLFSGIGGIDLGLDRAGLSCRWQVEIDPFCRKVLAKHWPHVRRYEDVTKLTGDELERVDLLAGGFPCQDLSQAGKRVGIEGTRSGLWFEYARLIGHIRPRYVLIENVPGLLVHDAMRRVVGDLARLGYVGCWLSLRASEFGASHIRKRVFLVAYAECSSPRPGFSTSQQEPRLRRQRFRDGGEPLMEDAARHEQCGLSGESRRMRRRRVCETSESVADTGNGLIPITGWRPEGRDGTRPASTPFPLAPGPNDTRWVDILRDFPGLAPSLETSKSAVRGVVDGIPDWMVEAMSDRTKRLSKLGNAVVPEETEWIGDRLLELDERLTIEDAA